MANEEKKQTDKYIDTEKPYCCCCDRMATKRALIDYQCTYCGNQIIDGE